VSKVKCFKFLKGAPLRPTSKQCPRVLFSWTGRLAPKLFVLYVIAAAEPKRLVKKGTCHERSEASALFH